MRRETIERRVVSRGDTRISVDLPTERLDGIEPRLIVDLDAIAANYRELRHASSPAQCGAVVKADAYGLGIEPVARTLRSAGCGTFFVTTAREGVELRAILPDARIFVLHGVAAGTELDYVEHQLCPVLHEFEELERWQACAGDRRLPTAIKVDSGMTRLGFSPPDLDRIASEYTDVDVQLLMSHLACAAEPGHSLNREQLRAFERARQCMPGVPASLSASGGTFLGPEFRFDIVRCGAALFGIHASPRCNGRVRPVVRLQASVLKVREVPTGRSIGYDAIFTTDRPSVIATIRIGYADGLPRRLANRGHVAIGERIAPIVGQVSMDLATVDVTELDRGLVRVGDRVDIMSNVLPVDAVARSADMIGYELLTGLGLRVRREYVGSSGSRRI